jgi:hypothetical protein
MIIARLGESESRGSVHPTSTGIHKTEAGSCKLFSLLATQLSYWRYRYPESGITRLFQKILSKSLESQLRRSLTPTE